MSEVTQDRIPVLIPGVLVSEAAQEVENNAAAQIPGAVATELTILVDPANSPQQGGNDGDFVINIDPAGENVPTHNSVVQLIARAIKAVGMFTVAAAGGMVFSKSANSHNNISNYVTLAAIFTFGVAELVIGVWIYMASLTYRRRLWIGGIVLFFSIWPLVSLHLENFA